MKSVAVSFRSVSKKYKDVYAVRDLSLDVVSGEILALVGSSGCGKTTVLRLLAGFEAPDSGEIYLGTSLVSSPSGIVSPESRGIGMVFQDYALFPHLTVAENIRFGIRSTTAAADARLAELLRLVDLRNHARRYPHELSGGERQRVAVARALAPSPALILLDEPFSNLDADRRTQMRDELRSILKSVGATAIFVTHDQEEALTIGDRLAVMRAGSIEQVGSPEEVFQHPRTRFIADFMGQTDFLPGYVTESGILTDLGLLPQRVSLPVGTPVEVAIRPDDIGFIPGVGDMYVSARRFLGAYQILCVGLPTGGSVNTIQPHTLTITENVSGRAFFDAGHPLAIFYQDQIVEEITNEN